MENSAQLLDQGFVQENKPFNIEDNLASKGKRLGNYVIDRIIVQGLSYALIFGVASSNMGESEMTGMIIVAALGLWIIYYSLFEAFTGKTIGKLITGSKVVNVDGSPISVGQAFGRTFSRIIPFEAFSFLGQKGIGWHDSLSDTRVINA